MKHIVLFFWISLFVLLFALPKSYGQIPGDATGDGKLGIEDAIYILQELTGFQHAIDNDNDGYDSSVDCNDNNFNIHPDAEEICDGLDNDCDDQTDEGNPGGGGACNTGQPGICESGTIFCIAGALVCTPDSSPSVEVCDGLDNDCDGQTDEGNPGGGGVCNTGQPGICETGTIFCTTGALVCTPDSSPEEEICDDSLDNDCDGMIDENCQQAVCGNGNVEGDEECDDGNTENTDECLNTCILAFCGDGFIRDGVEECDDGNLNNMDACLSSCVSATCGDGFIYPDLEECDDGNFANGDGCESDCTITKRTVFLTSTTHTGNLGGLDGANAICNQLAAAAELPGTYKAWISDDTSSPSESFTHHGQFVLVDGSLIAESWADLTDYAILNPINVDENGSTIPFTDIVWTNTNGDGSLYIYGVTCSNWTTDSSEESGTGGYYHLSDYRWSYGGFTTLCSGPQHLYCFEQ